MRFIRFFFVGGYEDFRKIPHETPIFVRVCRKINCSWCSFYLKCICCKVIRKFDKFPTSNVACKIAHLHRFHHHHSQPFKDVNVSGVEKPVARFKILDNILYTTLWVRECDTANVVKFVLCMCTTQNFHFYCVYRDSMWIYMTIAHDSRTGIMCKCVCACVCVHRKGWRERAVTSQPVNERMSKRMSEWASVGHITHLIFTIWWNKSAKQYNPCNWCMTLSLESTNHIVSYDKNVRIRSIHHVHIRNRTN